MPGRPYLCLVELPEVRFQPAPIDLLSQAMDRVVHIEQEFEPSRAVAISGY